MADVNVYFLWDEKLRDLSLYATEGDGDTYETQCYFILENIRFHFHFLLHLFLITFGSTKFCNN